VQAARRITLLVECAGLLVGARGDQVAVFGVEDEDQPHQHREQAFIEVLWLPVGQSADELRFRRRQAAQQADNLLGEGRRNRRLGVAARLQHSGQAVGFGIGEQPNAVEH
jgi:hypothetical protein